MTDAATKSAAPDDAVPPVHKEILVQAPAEDVFRLFTERMDSWWPRTYRLGQAKLERIVLESRLHGRLYQVCDDGKETNWGKVLVWDPPRRLMLAWQIDGTWQYNPDFVTEVEVTFTAQGPRTTHVVLEHRNLERYGAAAAAMGGGWSGLMALFAKAAEAA
jgi:uncharacterized protein YndB with AHSA1/START domain